MNGRAFVRYDLAMRVTPTAMRFSGYALAPVSVAWFVVLIFAWPQFIMAVYSALCVIMWTATWHFSRTDNFGERAQENFGQDWPKVNTAMLFHCAALVATLFVWVQGNSFLKQHWEMPALAFFLSSMATAAVGCFKEVTSKLVSIEENSAHLRAYESANYLVTVSLGLIGLVWFFRLISLDPEQNFAVMHMVALTMAVWFWAAFQNWRDGGRHIQVRLIKPLTVSVDNTGVTKWSRLSRSVWTSYVAIVLSVMTFLLFWRGQLPDWPNVGLTLALTVVGITAVVSSKAAALVTMRAWARARADG